MCKRLVKLMLVVVFGVIQVSCVRGVSSGDDESGQVQAAAKADDSPGTSVLEFKDIGDHHIGKRLCVRTEYAVVMNKYASSSGFTFSEGGKVTFEGLLRSVHVDNLVLVSHAEILEEPERFPHHNSVELPTSDILAIELTGE